MRKTAPLTVVVFASVFLSALLLSPTATAATCLVDVYGVDVIDSSIRGSIKNMGNFNTSVAYDIWVEKGSQRTLIKNGSLDMIPDQVHAISHEYSFSTGSYIIKLNATTDCGASDFESMGHIILEGFVCSDPEAVEGQTRCDYVDREYLECTTSGWQIIDRDEDEYCYNCPRICGDGECNCGENTTTCGNDCGTGGCSSRYLNEYRCLYDIKQRKVMFRNCSTEWKDIEECIHGCTGGECNPGPGQIAGCGVSIKTFDYMSSVTKDGSPYVTVTIENTGDETEMMTANLFVDGVVVGTQQSTVQSGDNFTKTFTYTPPTEPGSYTMKVRADAQCGSSDAATATLSVVEPGGVVQPPAVVMPPVSQQQPATTNVDFFPTLLDIVAYNSKVIVVDIDSSMEQAFTINVEGAPYQWFEYPGQIVVEREESVYIYMTPDTAGTYELTVTVIAQSEAKEFERKVDVFVAPKETTGVGGDTVLGYLVTQLAGFVEFVSQNIAVLLSLIIVALIIVIAIGRRHLKTEYEDLLPG